MVTMAYNAYCAISMEGDDDTYDGKTAGSRSWEVEATVNSLVGTLFHVIITRMGTDLIFLSRLGSTICFTNFGSHDPIVLYWNLWYTEPCYKGSLLYLLIILSAKIDHVCSGLNGLILGLALFYLKLDVSGLVWKRHDSALFEFTTPWLVFFSGGHLQIHYCHIQPPVCEGSMQNLVL